MAVAAQHLRSSIRFKFLFITTVVLLVATVIGTGLIVLNEQNTLDHFLADKGHSLGTYIANISKDPILLKDSIQLDAIVSEASKDADVVYALVQDTDGTFLTTPMASFNSKLAEVNQIVAMPQLDGNTKLIHEAIKKTGLASELAQEIRIDANVQGKVLIGLSKARIRIQLVKTIFFVLGVNIIVALVMGTILFIASKRLILTPVARLCEMTSRVANGDLSYTIDVTSRDELGILAASLNNMVGSLNHMVRQVNTATDELNTITGNLAGASGKVVDSAQMQAESVNDTSSAVLEINASIKGVAESVESLSLSATESSSSILEMAANIEEVAQNTATLSQSAYDVSSSIAQMAVSIKQVESGVSMLMASANSTASSVMQMDISIKQVEKNAADAATISEEVRKDAETGRAAVEASIAGINEIQRSSDITFEVINELSKRADDIGMTLSIIDDVAEQTNLLALNAAIIAAQAGEHGKGFAVVADEIKELAERTRSSTREISRVIKGVQDETSRAVNAIRTAEKSIAHGKTLSETSGTALTKIYSGVQLATDQMREIARATLEQSRGSQVIRDSMEQVSDMVSQIAKATREQAQGSELIIAATERTKQLTDQVRTATQEQSKVGGFITASTENITFMINQIRRACNEQTRGSAQIAGSVEDIQSSAAINLDATRIMDESMSSLCTQIEVLKKEMNSFTV
jgi:methyl-accepting chemotaxis protein